MVYDFKFKPYQRKFKTPLKTAHGIWKIREGIILSLTNEYGEIGWGEIAPLSWFGSETFEEALTFCQQLPQTISDEIIFQIPDQFPACQFGFESALESFILSPKISSSNLVGVGKPYPTSTDVEKQRRSPLTPLIKGEIENLGMEVSGLLPGGEAALSTVLTLLQKGYHTFKWKIGVDRIDNELNIFKSLTQILGSDEFKTAEHGIRYLRLDANRGLTLEQAERWLNACDQINEKSNLFIEYLEQPLPINAFDLMLELCNRYLTPIALDESVATLNQIQSCYQQGWRSIYIIKPAIVGSPNKLRSFCNTYQIDTVFSSVFETEIGEQFALKLAQELSNPHRAIGFGVNHWFIE